MIKRFSDRQEAGLLLARELGQYKDESIVFALPRGGVETAIEVARKLEAPLELVIARKITHRDPEFAVGAITASGLAVWNWSEPIVANNGVWRQAAMQKARKEAKRRETIYLAGHLPLKATGLTAVIVDDGCANGWTMQAAIGEIRQHEPARIVAAVPVVPRATFNRLIGLVDDVVTVLNPDDFQNGVGYHYENFPQSNDEEVMERLAEAGWH